MSDEGKEMSPSFCPSIPLSCPLPCCSSSLSSLLIGIVYIVVFYLLRKKINLFGFDDSCDEKIRRNFPMKKIWYKTNT
jgi:hypothetical protein